MLNTSLTADKTMDGSFNNEIKRTENRAIQGLKSYTRDEIKTFVLEYINEELLTQGITDVSIKGIEIHGSRNRGTARADSDLDVVFEYEGDIREDDFFTMLHDDDEPMYIEDIEVDLNPITEPLSEYMERSKAYDLQFLKGD